MRAAAILVALLCAAAPAAADPLDVALRPVARPVPAAPLRPEARPVVTAPETPLAVTVSTSTVPDIPAARQELRAEALMKPPALLVYVAAWTGASPPPRPGADTAAELAGPTRGKAPLRPELRPEGLDDDAAEAVVVAVAAPARPEMRPEMRPDRPLRATPVPAAADPGDAARAAVAGILAAAPPMPELSPLAVSLALRPPSRPAGITSRAEAARAERARGMVCGNPDIQGEVLSRINGAGACGIENPVLVRAVAGVRLSTAARLDCGTATALADWVRRGALPAIGNEGGGLASLRVVSEYACRGRNNQAGARLSEHAFGRAIDIAGFGLRNGGEITVLNGWGSRSHANRLRQMHQVACGPFGTVLGPEANRFHRDHFHFDTAQNRSGSYCR